MKSNELRINNLVLWGVNIAEIKGIHTTTFGFEENRKHHFYANVLSNKNMNYYCLNPEDIEPIPLNEEWLFKFGFFKFNNAYVLEDPKEGLFDFEFSVWHDMTYNSSEFNVKLESVHQLQNLYFALMSTELELVVSKNGT
jgi:hypothetical protein